MCKRGCTWVSRRGIQWISNPWKHPRSGWTGLWAAWWNWRYLCLCRGLGDDPSSPFQLKPWFMKCPKTVLQWDTHSLGLNSELWNSHLPLPHGYAHPANLRLEKAWKTSNNVVEEEHVLRSCLEKVIFWEDGVLRRSCLENIMFWDNVLGRSCFEIVIWEDDV